VLLGAVALALWHPGDRGRIGTAIEGRLLDLRFALRGPVAPPGTVAIVAFDDRAVSRLPAFPPSRTDIAGTVRRIFAAGAEAVALDLLLVDARADDPVLSEALSLGPTVLGVAEAPEGAEPTPLTDIAGFGLTVGLRAPAPLPAMGPAPGLQDHAALGHVTVPHDSDGMLRRMHPALTLRTPGGEVTLPGLAVAVTSLQGPRPSLVVSQGAPGGRLEGAWPTARLDREGALPLNFLGPAGTIPTHSAAALSDADLRGRIVFLGATATGFGDRHATSFDATLPGVEVQATLAANLLAGEVLRRDLAAWGLGGAIAVAVAVAGVWVGGLARPWVALLAGTGMTAAVLGLLQAAFETGWWLDATTVLVALSAGLAIGATRRFLETRRRAANLARYQSPRLVEAIASQADPLGGRAPQHAVVLFVDIAGFTTRAESLGPAATAGFLRAFHGQVEAAADPLGGTIMGFAGDGVLVVFGVPDPAEGDATRALQFLQRLFDTAERDGVHLRAGGHAGKVQFSLLGGTRHRIVSVSGDVVNTASRLQELAKTHGVALALSDSLVASESSARAWADTARMTPLVDQPLRGRVARETIWVGEVAEAQATGDRAGT
jgi:adenylate cyclase